MYFLVLIQELALVWWSAQVFEPDWAKVGHFPIRLLKIRKLAWSGQDAGFSKRIGTNALLTLKGFPSGPVRHWHCIAQCVLPNTSNAVQTLTIYCLVYNRDVEFKIIIPKIIIILVGCGLFFLL